MAGLERGQRKTACLPGFVSFGLDCVDEPVEGGLAFGRVHEINGLAGWSLAVLLAGRAGNGAVVWCTRAALDHRLYPPGCTALGLDPNRLVQVICHTGQEELWTAEEALRSNAARVVVLERDLDISLTAARRLQLAAEAGCSLGLVVSTARGAVCPVATSRWRATPARPAPFTEPLSNLRLNLELTRNRAGSGAQNWIVEWNETAHHLSLVSIASSRPDYPAQTRMAG